MAKAPQSANPNVIAMSDHRSTGLPQWLKDNLTNVLTGLGTTKDKLATTKFMTIELSPEQLMAAYRGDWIARKVIDIPAFDATREWRGWQAERGDITKIEQLEQTLGIQRKTMVGLQRARLYGGAALIMGVENGKPEDELIAETVTKDQLKFVHVVSRFDVSCGELETNIMSPYFGEPKWYMRNLVSGIDDQQGVKIHPSRVVRLIGAEMPDQNSMMANQGWGDSILQVVQDAIISAGMVTSGVAQLVAEAKIDVIKVPGLTQQMGNAEYEERLKKRFGLASDMKSIYNMLLMDGAEEWERISVSFAQLPEVLQLYLLVASGAADIPATRMLGQSPAGLSATGESDTRNYYDRISTEQNTILKPQMKRLDDVLVRSALGSYNETIFYNWNPLWQMSAKEKAEVAKSKADTFLIDVNAALINPDVLREARVNQLIEDGTYPGLEDLIDEFGTEPEEDEASAPATPEEMVAMGIDPNDPNAAMLVQQQRLKQSAANLNDPNAVPPGEEEDEDEEQQVSNLDWMLDNIKTGRRLLMRSRDGVEPKTLYIRRDVANAAELLRWAKAAGISETLPASELHVTIAYSRTPVDWTKVGSAEWGQDERGIMRVPPGGVRLLAKFGPAQDVLVLVFTSSNLSYRHCSVLEAGATWSWPDYQPHITIGPIPKDTDLSKIEPYRGEIVLGPEIFEEVQDTEYDVNTFKNKDAKTYPEPTSWKRTGRKKARKDARKTKPRRR